MPKKAQQSSPGFRGAVDHLHIDEARLAQSFQNATPDEVVAVLESLISGSRHKYEKVAAVLETVSVTDEAVETKWRAVQARINEEVYGIVNWQVILDELDEARDAEKQILKETEAEKNAIRKKLPTVMVVASGAEEAAPFELDKVLPAAPDLPFDLVPDGEAVDTRPEPKRTLMERVERLADKKRRQLAEIHERKVALVNAHGEKLLQESALEAAEQTRQLNAFHEHFKGAFEDPSENPDNVSDESGPAALEKRIDAIEAEREAKVTATRQAWDQSLDKLAAREKALHAQFDEHIDEARSTFGVFEDSGLFVVPDEVRLGFDIADQRRAIDFLDKSEAVLTAGDQMPKEELTRIRSSILLIWEKHDDAGLRSKAVRALQNLIFSNLADASKGRLISLLIQGLDTSAAKEAAGALQEIVSEKGLYLRLSVPDAETIIRCVSNASVPVRVAAIMVVANQLFLAQNKRIPKYPADVSNRLLQALLAAMGDPANQGVFGRLADLGYVQLGDA